MDVKNHCIISKVSMRYKKTTLKNGLRVITVPIPTLESVTVTVWVKAGSRLEDRRVNGISHFLEHMVFKGSKKRPSYKEIFGAVDSFGGEMNAGTSKEWTNFYIRCSKKHLEESFDILSDMVLNPLLKEQEIEREKGVIIEEINMYEDTPIMKIADVFEALVYNGNALGWDTSGIPKTVKAIKRSDFLRYREKHYYAENMLLTVAGGIKSREISKLAGKYFGQLRGRRKSQNYSEFVSRQTKPQVSLKSKKNEQAHIILGFLGDRRDHKDRFVEAVLASILGGPASSRLFIEIREKRGLAYSVKTSSDHYVDTGTFATYSGIDTNKIDEAIKVMLEQHYGLANGKLPVSAKELKKAKEFLKGNITLALEDTRAVNNLFGESELFLNKVETPEEIFAKVDKVTVGDIVRVAKKLFRPNKLNLAIIGPYNDSRRFEKLLRF